jgi:uncharacterized protein YbjQ (UPF0145 family)
MKLFLFIIAILGITVLIGCSPTSTFSYLNDGITVGDTTSVANIKLYTTRDIGRPYIELGGVGVSFSNELEGKKYSDQLKKEAAKIGADAVVDVRQFGTTASGIAVKFK